MGQLGFSRLTILRFLRCHYAELDDVLETLALRPHPLTRRYTVEQARQIMELFYSKPRDRPWSRTRTPGK